MNQLPKKNYQKLVGYQKVKQLTKEYLRSLKIAIDLKFISQEKFNLLNGLLEERIRK